MAESSSWDSFPKLAEKDHAFVPEQIAQTLRHEIAAGRIPPGTKLPEVLLSTSMGVSRHTLRAGLHVLEEEGMAQRIPNRGVFVLSPTLSDLVEVYRVRRIVELGILRTVPFGSAAVDVLERVVSETDTTDIRALAEANQSFHRIIVEQAESELLDRTMSRVFAQMQLAFSGYDITAYTDFRARHFTVIEHLRAGDANGAARVLEVYLQDSERIAVAGFAGGRG